MDSDQQTLSSMQQKIVELEKANNELTQFAYIVSHDLKAPLRAINNLSQWIEEDISDVLTEDSQNHLKLLRGRVARMEKMITGILEYSRIGRFPVPLETSNINDCLDEIVNSLAPPEEFTVIIEPDMPCLKTARLHLEQVFTNLIGNAIKHHDRRNGKVEISARDEGDNFKFLVTDDGPV